VLLLAAAVYFAWALFYHPSSGGPAKNGTASKQAKQVEPQETSQPAKKKKPSKSPSPKEISVIAVGDILFDRQVGSLIDNKGPDEPLRYVAPILSSSDITIANLECPLSTKGTKLAEKDVTFRGRTSAATGIKNAGIDVVSMANNHALDCGPEALEDTIALLDQKGIGHSGAGMNLNEAVKAAYFKAGDKKDKKVAFLAFSYLIPAGFYPGENRAGVAPARPDTELVTNAIKEARKRADFVFCSFHWGIEYQDYPVQYQIDLGRLCIDTGADLVLGGHPHVIQGIELYKGKLIAYSLGDFVFDHYSRKTGEAFILKCDVSQEKTLSATMIPVYLASFGQPKVVNGADANSILNRLSQISKKFETKMRIEQDQAILEIP
jgi:poly-gamma-glutamate capsule biosynthesis protein CapA/YwtB (metallophosphatase superfamily)